MSGDVAGGFLDGATAAEVRAANRLLPAELESRDVHRRGRLMRRARFPQAEPFEGYDYSQVAFPDGYGPADLESLAFLDTAEGCVSSRGFEQKEHRKLSSLSIGGAHAF